MNLILRVRRSCKLEIKEEDVETEDNSWLLICAWHYVPCIPDVTVIGDEELKQRC